MSPRISRFQDFIPQEDASTERGFTVINYSSRDGGFSIAIPEHMQSVVGAGILYSETQYGVEQAWKAAKEKYSTLKKAEKCRKIIVIDFQASVLIDRPEVNVYLHKDDLHFKKGPIVQFTFMEGNELSRIRDGARTDFDIVGLDMRLSKYDRHNRDGILIVDWTQERVDFLRKIKTAMENLILKLDEFTTSVGEDNSFLEAKMKEGLLLTE